ncbi:MAG: type II secretion system F family protein [Gammaproteobacteria bacterium]
MSNKSKKNFVWSGNNAQGENLSGEISATSLLLAKVELRQQGITPKKVQKKSTAWLRKLGEQKIQSSDIAIFIRQLSTLLNAGVALVQALAIIGHGHTNSAMRKMIMTIKTRVESGEPLTKALQEHPQYFNNLFCNLVNAGEQSGSLDDMLSKLAAYREHVESLRKKIKNALSYPFIVLVVASLITVGLLVFIVPQFETIFSNFGADLPLPTRLVLETSRALQESWWIILGVILLMVVIAKRMLQRSKQLQISLDRLKLKLPIFGKIINAAIISRLMRTLATTFAAGLPLVEALHAISGAAGNRLFSAAIKDVRENVSTGKKLQTAINETGLFPSMVVQMVGIGEESGSLEFMLNKIADFYEEEVNNAVENLSSLIEPLIMIVLGVIIGGLVIALYLPIFRMGSVI